MTHLFAAFGIFIAAFGILMLVSWLCGVTDRSGLGDSTVSWIMSTFISALFITLMFIYYEF